MILKKVTILLLMLISLIACEGFLEDIFNPRPKYAIYRTNGDYYHNYNTYYTSGKTPVTLSYPCEDSVFFIDEEDTIYTFRIRLDNNYILNTLCTQDDQFTDLSFEHYCKEMDSSYVRSESFTEFIESRIVDSDPFIDYFDVDPTFIESYITEFVKGRPYKEAKYLGLKQAAFDINIIIKDGTLGDNFKKIK